MCVYWTELLNSIKLFIDVFNIIVLFPGKTTHSEWLYLTYIIMFFSRELVVNMMNKLTRYIIYPMLLKMCNCCACACLNLYWAVFYYYYLLLLVLLLLLLYYYYWLDLQCTFGVQKIISCNLEVSVPLCHFIKNIKSFRFFLN